MGYYGQIARDRTHVNLGAERTIKASGGLDVYGIVIANKDAAAHTVQFRDADDNVELEVRVAADTSFEVETSWTSDNGLKVREPDANNSAVTVTVFHNNISGSA